jgi:glycosidase
MLHLYRALTRLRASEPALRTGPYASVDAGDADVFAYLRGGFLIALNFSDTPCSINLAAVAPKAEIAVATDMVRSGSVVLDRLALGPNEGLVLRLPTSSSQVS